MGYAFACNAVSSAGNYGSRILRCIFVTVLAMVSGSADPQRCLKSGLWSLMASVVILFGGYWLQVIRVAAAAVGTSVPAFAFRWLVTSVIQVQVLRDFLPRQRVG